MTGNYHFILNLITFPFLVGFFSRCSKVFRPCPLLELRLAQPRYSYPTHTHRLRSVLIVCPGPRTTDTVDGGTSPGDLGILRTRTLLKEVVRERRVTDILVPDETECKLWGYSSGGGSCYPQSLSYGVEVGVHSVEFRTTCGRGSSGHTDSGRRVRHWTSSYRTVTESVDNDIIY